MGCCSQSQLCRFFAQKPQLSKGIPFDSQSIYVLFVVKNEFFNQIKAFYQKILHNILQF